MSGVGFTGRTPMRVSFGGAAHNPSVLLALLTVLFFWPLTLQGEVLFWGTPLLQFFPWRDLAVAEYLSGRLPLWDPYSGFGAPLAANMQSGVFYPLNLFYFALPIERAMTLTVVLHVFLAGLFTYGFGRALGRTTGGAMVAALTFMFSGYVIARAGFLSIVCVVAWLPAVLLGVERALNVNPAATGRDRLRAAVGLAAATAMLLLAGHIQLAYYILVLAGAYLLWQSVARTGISAATIKCAIPPAAGILLGVAAAAVQLAPAWELARESVRQQGMDYLAATSYSLWPGQLLGAVAPNFFGSQAAGDWWGPGAFWEGVIYAGILPLALMALAIRFRFDRTAAFFCLMGGVGLLLALGRYNPLFEPLFRSAPGLGLFQAPARFTLWYTFGLAVLAGAGWDALEAHKDASFRFGAMVTVVGIGLCLAAGMLTVSGGELGAVPALRATAAGGGWMMAAGLLLAIRNRLAPRWWAAGVLTIIFLDLFAFGAPLNPTTDARLYHLETSAAASPPQESRFDRYYTTEAAYQESTGRYFSFKGPFISDWRVLAGLQKGLTPGLATTERLFEAYNFDPIRLRRATRLQEVAEASGLPKPLLDAMNVRYLPAYDPPPNATPWAPGGQLMVYQRDLGLPRAYVARATVRVASLEEALGVMTAPGFDPARVAVVEAPDDLPARGPGAGSARIVEYTPSRVTIDVDSGGGMLVLSDSYYPGWVARVDGRQVTVIPANAAFRGVPLPSGRHRVEFSYEPASVRLGLGVTAAALAVMASLGGFAFLPFGRRA